MAVVQISRRCSRFSQVTADVAPVNEPRRCRPRWLVDAQLPRAAV